jgi:multidrug efflux system membrane fusion protein
VVKPDNTVEVRTVTVAATQGDVIALNSGVAPGERIVTDGLDKLQAGTKVIVQTAAKQEAPKQAAAKATVQRSAQ